MKVTVEGIAEQFDRYINVLTFNREGSLDAALGFGNWLGKYVIAGGRQLFEILDHGGISPDAKSKCKDGKGTVYWYDFGRVIVGIPDTRNTFFIVPTSENMPEVKVSEE